MKAVVGITDHEWFDLNSDRPQLDEVNFWLPDGNSRFWANSGKRATQGLHILPSVILSDK